MAFKIIHLLNLMWKFVTLCLVVFSYLLSDLRSLISTFRKGRNAVPQNGHVLLRLESSAVQPAMISSSYTRHSHVLQSEQLDISTCKTAARRQKNGFGILLQRSDECSCFAWLTYLGSVTGRGLEATNVWGGVWSARSFRCQRQTPWIWGNIDFKHRAIHLKFRHWGVLWSSNNSNSDSTGYFFIIFQSTLKIDWKNSNKPEKELCLNTLLGVPGLPRLECPAIGLLLSLDIVPCCGEVKPSGSRQESTSSRDEQSASPEVSEDTLIWSQFTSWRKRGGDFY